MSKIFGVVTKPLFDENVFKVNQALSITDYIKGVEYNAIVVEVAPLFIDVLTYDATSLKAIFVRVGIDDFVKGNYELKVLVEVELRELYEGNKEKPKEDLVASVDMDLDDFVKDENVELIVGEVVDDDDVENYLTESGSSAITIELNESSEYVS